MGEGWSRLPSSAEVFRNWRRNGLDPVSCWCFLCAALSFKKLLCLFCLIYMSLISYWFGHQDVCSSFSFSYLYFRFIFSLNIYNAIPLYMLNVPISFQKYIIFHSFFFFMCFICEAFCLLETYCQSLSFTWRCKTIFFKLFIAMYAIITDI